MVHNAELSTLDTIHNIELSTLDIIHNVEISTLDNLYLTIYALSVECTNKFNMIIGEASLSTSLQYENW